MSEPRVLWLEDDPAVAVAAARAVLRNDAAIVFPSDTVYGLIALAQSRTGYLKAYALKGREYDKPLALLANCGGMKRQLAPLLAAVEAAGLLTQFLDGELTAVVSTDKIADFPHKVAAIQPGPVGVRCPKHRYLKPAIGAPGWLWATSVNRSGEPPATTADEVLAWLEELRERGIDSPELVVLSRTPGSGKPSSVIDLTGDEPKRLR